jgi:hypothetical protein
MAGTTAVPRAAVTACGTAAAPTRLVTKISPRRIDDDEKRIKRGASLLDASALAIRRKASPGKCTPM